MRKFRTSEQWEQTTSFDVFAPRARFKVRCSGNATVYQVLEDATRVPVGFCQAEEIEVEVTGSERQKFEIEGDPAFVRSLIRQEVIYRATNDKFTTMDRPAPMSAEMQLIHRMQRQNELEREFQMREMERKLDARLQSLATRKNKGATSADSTEEDNETTVRKKRKSGSADIEERSGDAESNAVSELDVPPEPKKTRGRNSPKGDEKVSADGDTDSG